MAMFREPVGLDLNEESGIYPPEGPTVLRMYVGRGIECCRPTCLWSMGVGGATRLLNH